MEQFFVWWAAFEKIYQVTIVLCWSYMNQISVYLITFTEMLCSGITAINQLLLILATVILQLHLHVVSYMWLLVNIQI
jgi:hypothetical protein